MPRIPMPSRDKAPPAQMAAFDEIARGRTAIPEWSPTGMMANSPEAARHFERIKVYLRDDSTALPLRVRELAMILTGRDTDSPCVWDLHAASARRAGLSDQLVDALRDRKELPQMDSDEAAVVKFAGELHRDHSVKPETLRAVLDHFGVQGSIELTMLLALYVMPAFIAHAFGIEPSQDSPEPRLPL